MKNESVKKSLKKSKNVLEEKRKTVLRKICIKKTHVYNNCYELRSRAINHECVKIFKKRKRLNTIQILSIVKRESAQIIAVERLTAAIKKTA